MKRLLLAAFAAAFAFTSSASSEMRYIRRYSPTYRTEAPKLPEPVIGSYQAIHTIAILSGLGTRFDLERRGVAAKKQDTLDITAWKLDERIETIVRDGMPGPYTFAAVSYDRSKLAPLRASTSYADRYDAFLKELPANGVDAFVIVRPNSAGGIALQTVEQRDTILWIDFEIDVVDAHSLMVIAKSTARVQPPGAAHPNFPGLVLGKEFALGGSLTVSADTQEKLRILTNEMLAVTLTETLRSLKLGPGR